MPIRVMRLRCIKESSEGDLRYIKESSEGDLNKGYRSNVNTQKKMVMN